MKTTHTTITLEERKKRLQIFVLYTGAPVIAPSMHPYPDSNEDDMEEYY